MVTLRINEGSSTHKLGHVAINQIDPWLDVRVLGMGQQPWTPDVRWQGNLQIHSFMTPWRVEVKSPLDSKGFFHHQWLSLKILGENPLKTNNWCFIKVRFHCKSARTFAGSPWQMVGFLLGYQESEVFFCGKDPQWSDLWLDKNHWR